MIIGLTGSYCSGKDTVADYIVKNNGFTPGRQASVRIRSDRYGGCGGCSPLSDARSCPASPCG